jgi:hypothetical protein
MTQNKFSATELMALYALKVKRNGLPIKDIRDTSPDLPIYKKLIEQGLVEEQGGCYKMTNQGKSQFLDQWGFGTLRDMLAEITGEAVRITPANGLTQVNSRLWRYKNDQDKDDGLAFFLQQGEDYLGAYRSIDDSPRFEECAGFALIRLTEDQRYGGFISGIVLDSTCDYFHTYMPATKRLRPTD